MKYSICVAMLVHKFVQYPKCTILNLSSLDLLPFTVFHVVSAGQEYSLNTMFDLWTRPVDFVIMTVATLAVAPETRQCLEREVMSWDSRVCSESLGSPTARINILEGDCTTRQEGK